MGSFHGPTKHAELYARKANEDERRQLESTLGNGVRQLCRMLSTSRSEFKVQDYSLETAYEPKGLKLSANACFGKRCCLSLSNECIVKLEFVAGQSKGR